MTWQRVKVGDLCKVGRGSSPRPINDSRFFEDGDIPWVKVADATASGKYLYETKEHVNKFGASFSRLLPAGSLIICTSGTLGYPIFLGVDGCIHDGWLYTFDYNGLDPHFFYYFLKVNSDYFYSVAYGAAIQNINTEILRNTPISLPPLENQHRIAAILSAYDDLIENNRRRIQLLEQAARLIYREWFVRLRFPGHERVRVVDGMPEGWELMAMADVCQALGGGTPDTKSPAYWVNGEITWVIPSDITKNDCLVLLDSEKKITEAGLRNSSAKLLPPNTILMTSRASVGFFGLIDREVCTNQGFIAVIPNAENLRMYLLFNLLSRRDEILQNAKGTTYLEINKATFRRMSIVVPSDTVLDAFQAQASLLIRQVRLIKRQMEKLKQARDLLLPRLMSGEIAV